MFVPVKDESSLRAKSSESRSEFRYVSIKRNSSMIEQRVVSPNNYLSKLNLQVNHSKDVPPLILEERICSYGRGGDLSIERRVIREKAKRLAIREDLKTFLLTSANEDDKERILLERKEDGCNRREEQIFLNRVLTFG